MKTKEYYRRLLAAVRDARIWAGRYPPEEMREIQKEHDELRREVLRRRRRCRR